MAVAETVAVAEEGPAAVDEDFVIVSLASRRVHLLQLSLLPRQMLWLLQLQQEVGPVAEVEAKAKGDGKRGGGAGAGKGDAPPKRDESGVPPELRQNQCTETYDEIRKRKNADGHFVCLWYVGRGKCVAGENCKWAHDDAFAASLSAKEKSHIVSEQERQRKVREHQKQKKGPGGAGGSAGPKANAKAKPEAKSKAAIGAPPKTTPTTKPISKMSPAEKKKVPCAFFGTPKGCTRGDQCPFKHDPKLKSKDGVPSS